MHKDYRNIIKIASHYGLENQISKTREELEELCEELSAEVINREAVIGEVADVTIMVSQLMYLMNFEYELDGMISYKIARQLNRIKQEEKA